MHGCMCGQRQCRCLHVRMYSPEYPRRKVRMHHAWFGRVTSIRTHNVEVSESSPDCAGEPRISRRCRATHTVVAERGTQLYAPGSFSKKDNLHPSVQLDNARHPRMLPARTAPHAWPPMLSSAVVPKHASPLGSSMVSSLFGTCLRTLGVSRAVHHLYGCCVVHLYVHKHATCAQTHADAHASR